jgi:hypothetical protein
VSGTKVVNETIIRPKPAGKWSAVWHWRTDRIETAVTASYAADTPGEFPPVQDGDDPVEVPNNITIRRKHQGASDNVTEMRFTRHAAELLIDQLAKALDWDGQ